jgi:hypothetical protein
MLHYIYTNCSGLNSYVDGFVFRAHGFKELGMAIAVRASVLGAGDKGQALSSTLRLGARRNQ